MKKPRNQISAHPVGPLADSLDVGLVPLPRHAIDDLTVIHKVAGDVSTAYEGRLLPGQHHGVTHTLQHSDAIGWSRGGWDDRKLKLTPLCLSRATGWRNSKLKHYNEVILLIPKLIFTRPASCSNLSIILWNFIIGLEMLLSFNVPLLKALQQVLAALKLTFFHGQEMTELITGLCKFKHNSRWIPVVTEYCQIHNTVAPLTFNIKLLHYDLLKGIFLDFGKTPKISNYSFILLISMGKIVIYYINVVVQNFQHSTQWFLGLGWWSDCEQKVSPKAGSCNMVIINWPVVHK